MKMNKLLIGSAATALCLSLGPALAQPAPPPPPGVAQGTAPLPTMRHVPPVVHGPAIAMPMGDRVMTRDEMLRHVRTMFARLDTNRDGFITRDEVAAFHGGMMHTMPMGGFEEHGPDGFASRDRAALFNRLDTNHDGVISRQEFMAARPEIRERRVMVMRNEGALGTPGMQMHEMHMHEMGMRGGFGAHLFAMADANRDGRVSLREAEAAALAHFDRVDLNHDGRITPDERRQAHELMHMEQHPG